MALLVDEAGDSSGVWGPIAAGALLRIPMIVHGRRLGGFVLRATTAGEIAPDAQALSQALAAQAGLALHLRRLEREREAIAAEREYALARDTETSRANAAMRECLDVIGQATDLEQLRPSVLGTMIKLLGAIGGSLWRYNADDGSVTLDHEYVGGELFARQQSGFQHGERHHFLASHPASYEKHRRLIRGETLILDVERSDMFLDHERDHLRAQGVRALIVMPLEAAGRHLGRLALAFGEPRVLSASEFALARTLTNQAALIIEATVLAEAATRAAVAVEREAAAQRHVKQLLRANAALTEAIDVLASDFEIDGMLGHTLRTICDDLAGPSGSATLWLSDERFEYERLHLIYEHGRVQIGGQSQHPAAQQRRPVSRELFETRPEPGRAERIAVDALPQAPREHLQKLGVRSILSLPMLVAGQPAGVFVVRLAQDGAEPEARAVEIAEALVQQAALALQLTRLAEQAKRAAIAREQERAARLREQQLIKASEALKRSVDLLASDPDIDRALGHVLQVITEQIDAPSSALWMRLDDSEVFHVQLIYHHGEIMPAGASDLATRLWPTRRDLHWRDHIRLRRPVVYELERMTELPDDLREFFKSLDVKVLLGVPLVLGDEVIGCFTVRFPSRREFREDQLELVQTLAHQATLALQLERLSREAQRKSQHAATLAERARIARDLHDTLAQGLTGILVHLQAAQRIEDGAAARLHVGEALGVAREALVDARRSVYALRTISDERGDLQSLLRAVLKTAFAGTWVLATVDSEGRPLPMSDAVENELLRIAQEAATNTLKHGRATRFDARLCFRDPEILLRLEDNGIGFDTALASEGFGLTGIAERAARIGARVALDSAPGQGTRIEVTLPLPSQR